MVDYNRSTKTSSGQTAMIDGVPIPAADYELDQSAIATSFGNCAPSSGIEWTALDGYSDSATEQKSSADPGSGSSLSAASTGDEELQRLRYAVERLALGISGTTHAVRYDGSSNVNLAWLDFPHRYGNLLANPLFAIKTTGATAAPDGWSLVGTPTNCAQATAVVTEGAGKVLNIVADASTEGISQTLSGLKAGRRYLVVARARANSGTARLSVTGADATSQFRTVSVDTTSATFVPLSAVFQVDATPTECVVNLLAVANTDDVDFSRVAVYECSVDALYPVESVAVRTTFTTATANAFPSGSFGSAYLSTAVTVPGPGYKIRARARIDFQATSGTNPNLVIVLKRGSTEVDTFRATIGTGFIGSADLSDLFTAPVAGTTYTYTIEGYGGSGAFSMNPSALTTETPRSVLDLELERA